jgi:hypothetical protein
LWLYADDGPHIVTTYSGITGYISITALPSGHNWTRDINGRIQGCLSVYGTDNNGAYQSGSIGVGVNYAPQSIGANLKNSSEWWCYCDKAMVSFYSPGASSYQISKRTQFFTGTWSNWSTPVTVSGDCNQFTYTGLNQYDNYQFQVKAINSFGTVTSNILQRNRCSNYLYTAPNPLSVTANSIFNISINPSGGGPIHIDYSDLECGADAMIAFDNMGIDNTLAVVIPPAVDPCGPQNTHITNVTFSNVANQLLTYPFNFDGSSINVILDVKNMIPGIYTMSVFSSDGLIISDEVQIDQ